MSPKGLAAMTIGVLGVLLVILSLQDVIGPEWDNVSLPVALVSLMIVIFGFTIYIAKKG